MKQYIYRFVVTNALTLFYGFLTLVIFLWNYVRNPFRNPWEQKLRLVPPAPLSDPKYGIHKNIKVNGIKLHYIESGDPSKPLMIFLHGFPEFWYSWRYQILEFKKDYWCIAVDMRGYGDSERVEDVSAYKLNLLIDDIKYLVKELGREKCILVSHDWGGAIANAIRNAYPEIVSALIMLASMSTAASIHEIWNNSKQFLMSWYFFLFRLPWLPEQFVLMNDLEIHDKILLVPGNTYVDKQDVECYKYWFCKPYALTPPINYYRANFDYIANDKYYKDNVPMLVVHAAKDLYINKTVLEAMKKQYEYIETVIVDGVGHALQQHDPDRINKIIRDFLAKNNL